MEGNRGGEGGGKGVEQPIGGGGDGKVIGKKGGKPEDDHGDRGGDGKGIEDIGGGKGASPNTNPANTENTPKGVCWFCDTDYRMESSGVLLGGLEDYFPTGFCEPCSDCVEADPAELLAE